MVSATAAALRLSEQAMATVPIERDALLGPTPIETLARVAAPDGKANHACRRFTEAAINTV